MYKPDFYKGKYREKYVKGGNIMNKRIKAVFLLFAMTISFVGCESSQQSSNIDLFDTQVGFDISKEYLANIKQGDISSANKLCSQELIDGSENIGEGVSEISSYNKDYWVDGKDHTYYLFNVIRTSSVEPKSDLETYTIKVEKINDQYLITSVKAQSKKELYVKNKSLRIVEEEKGNSSLVVNLDSLPKDTYLSNNKIMLYKQKVPTDKFGKVALSFSGKKVAISTTDGSSNYICVVDIEDSAQAMAENDASSSNVSGSNNIEDLEELLEKPIATKVVSIDLLKDITIDNYIFSAKENTLAVNYSQNEKKQFNLYNAEEGEMIGDNIKEMFDNSKYELEAVSFEGDEIKFKATAYGEDQKAESGEYSFNIETQEIKKL